MDLVAAVSVVHPCDLGTARDDADMHVCDDATYPKVSNLNHATEGTVLFQRLSVIVTDSVLLYGAMLYTSSMWPEDRARRIVVTCLLLLNTGLTIVDHIHFQYNGFLYGQLIISLACIQREWYALSTEH